MGDLAATVVPLGSELPGAADADDFAVAAGASQGKEPAAGEPAVGEAVVGESVVVLSTGELRERSGAAVFRQAARSIHTLLAYRADWDRCDEHWCRHRVAALPVEPGVVASYLAEAANTCEGSAGRRRGGTARRP